MLGRSRPACLHSFPAPTLSASATAAAGVCSACDNMHLMHANLGTSCSARCRCACCFLLFLPIINALQHRALTVKRLHTTVEEDAATKVWWQHCCGINLAPWCATQCAAHKRLAVGLCCQCAQHTCMHIFATIMPVASSSSRSQQQMQTGQFAARQNRLFCWHSRRAWLGCPPSWRRQV